MTTHNQDMAHFQFIRSLQAVTYSFVVLYILKEACAQFGELNI